MRTISSQPDSRAFDPLIFALRLAAFFASLAFLAYAAAHSPRAQAAVEQFVIKSGTFGSTVGDAGWHFDEVAGTTWGAKDYPPAGGTYDANLWAVMRLNSGYMWRYTVYDPGMPSCRVYAYAAWSTNGYAWQAVNGLDIHYLHLASKITGWTGSMQYFDSGIWFKVGTIATGSPCIDGTTGQPHVHLSGDLAPLGSPTYTFPVKQNHLSGTGDDETCWAPSDWQCAGTANYTRKTSSGCNFSVGSWPRSGLVYFDYTSCSWMERSIAPVYSPDHYGNMTALSMRF